jgi:hypothetical protein
MERPPWPAPPDPLDRTVEAGFTPTTHEFLQVHRHAHLDVFVNGKPVTVLPGIGIDITDPGVKTTPSDAGDTYGGIEECDDPCISPLHAHDYTGVLHTESTESRLNTLGVSSSPNGAFGSTPAASAGTASRRPASRSS